MNRLDTYKKANKFFQGNRKSVEEKYKYQIKEFERYYDDLIRKITAPPQNLDEQKYISISLLLRALKYIYTALNLVLFGHVHERSIVLRNVIELRMVALDIAFNGEGYKIWKACWQEKERIVNTKNKKVDSSAFNKDIYKLYKTKKRIKSNKTILDYINRKDIFKNWGALSEYWSHENLYNIVRKIDWIDNKDGTKTIKPYLGYSVSNSGLGEYINDTLKNIKELNDDFEFIVNG